MVFDLKWFSCSSSLVLTYLFNEKVHLYCNIHILMFNSVNMKNISKVLLVIKPESESDLLNKDTNDSMVVFVRPRFLLHTTFSPKLKTLAK
jgi:hypothetical protein